jgi:hypothetical protein
MRYIVGGITIAAILVLGLTLRPEPRSTAAVDGLPMLSAPGGMHPALDGKNLPWLKQVNGGPVRSQPLRCRVLPESLGDIPRPKRCDILEQAAR